MFQFMLDRAQVKRLLLLTVSIPYLCGCSGDLTGFGTLFDEIERTRNEAQRLEELRISDECQRELRTTGECEERRRQRGGVDPSKLERPSSQEISQGGIY